MQEATLNLFQQYLRDAYVTVTRQFFDGDWSVSFFVHPTNVSFVKVKDVPFPVEKVPTATGRRATPPVLCITTEQGSLFFVYQPQLFVFADTGFTYFAETYTVRWECVSRR